MSRTDTLDHIVRTYRLDDTHVYLLELVPLLEMMWADGLNQPSEMRIIYSFAIEHAARLSKAAYGQEVISDKQINAFLDRFAHVRPPGGLLRDLRQIVWELLGDGAHGDNPTSQRSLLDVCIDIAAACDQAPGRWPAGSRVVEQEKALMLELMQTLKLDPSQPAPFK